MLYKIFCISFLLNVYHVTSALLPYDRSQNLSASERNCLYGLVLEFDGARSSIDAKLHVADDGYFLENNRAVTLIKRFISCIRNQHIENPLNLSMADVDKILLSFVNNKIGRETIYRIIAKIESKTNCINSLIEIINFLKTCQDTKAKFYVSTNLLKDLNIISPSDISSCYKILIQFANNGPSGEEYSCFSRLLFEPKIFIMNCNSPDGNDISFSPDDEKQVLVVINSVIEKLNLYSWTILNNIQEACVKIIYSPNLSNYYTLNNNTIVFTGSYCKANIVTGPILKCGNNLSLGIETR